MTRNRPLFPAVGIAGLAAIVVLAYVAVSWFEEDEKPLPSFSAQACALDDDWLLRINRGHFPQRSGEISLLPRQPAYMASGAGGWSHSGPWPYLQDVPLVFYGPGIVRAGVEVDEPVTVADIAPTIAGVLRSSFKSDGRRLDDVASFGGRQLLRDPPRLAVTIVWDGGGWNTLDQWPDAWPNLQELIASGTSYTNATVGSSPSVTPSVHTTLGTGYFPATHGISGIPVRTTGGEIADSFLKGESARLLEVPTFAERWDEQTGNRARIGMIGYEPWHLGMIGAGAERPGGDRDDAAWLDVDTNEWISNPDHYRLPRALLKTTGLESDLEQLDAADGAVDGAWRTREILDQVEHFEETPAFIEYHTRALINLIEREGYGRDGVTDLLFTNYKQIDRVGHYYTMGGIEVRDSVVESDRQLAVLVDFLDEEVGRGKYLVIVTADHGQQPDDEVIDGYGINPNELEADLSAQFDVTIDRVLPTQVFLPLEEMRREGVTVEEVARFIGDYRLEENITSETGTFGSFEPDDRIFEMAVPSELLPISC